MTFAPPASTGTGDSVRLSDLENHLCIFKPTDYREKITTVMGESDAVVTNVIDLDTNTEHADVLIFNSQVRGALKPRVGQMVLAWVTKGQAKNPAHTAPWILKDATTDAAAVAKANAWLTGQVVAPAAPAAPAGVDISDPNIQALLAQLGAQKA